jgi:pimeloyl-ACP methyl ester carboxylesterase
VGQTFFTDKNRAKQKWKIVNVSANAETGFQGMAVVPLVNGVEDWSRVSIAFAGTNFSDPHDVSADTGVVAGTRIAQADDAFAFAAKVKELTLKDHPEATFETVGHSLGGYLALLVAAENRWSSRAFNAPDPWRVLSKEAQEWLLACNAAGTNPLTNWVNRFDPVGNSLGNRSGAAVYVDDVPNRSVPEYHNLGKDADGNAQGFRFDADGGIVGAGVTPVDRGVLLYNLGLTGAAQLAWQSQKNSPYPKVLVALEGAMALATSIRALAEPLNDIKKTNKDLVPSMQKALDDACSAQMFQGPWVRHQDVENCVRTHGLEVHENIDEDDLAAVNTLVDRHLALVEALHDGIRSTVVSTLIQDGRAAEGFRGR